MSRVLEFPPKAVGERLNALEIDLRALRANVEAMRIVLAGASESIMGLLRTGEAFQQIANQFVDIDARFARMDAEIELLKVQKAGPGGAA